MPIPNRLHRYLILASGWAVALWGHYILVPGARTPFQVSLTDPFVHGLIAALTIFMIYGRGLISLKELILFVSFAILIDLDHGIAARSLDLKDWVSLPRRPFSHSILFSLVVAAVVALWLGRERKALYFHLVAVVLISHVTRDAISGAPTPWNLPFSPVGIPAIPYFATWMAISLGHDFFPRRHRTGRTREAH